MKVDELTLALALEEVKRHIGEIVRKDKKKILILLLFLAFIFVIAVSATIYNSMFMQSGIGVKG